jgi:hypothetical protein
MQERFMDRLRAGVAEARLARLRNAAAILADDVHRLAAELNTTKQAAALARLRVAAEQVAAAHGFSLFDLRDQDAADSILANASAGRFDLEVRRLVVTVGLRRGAKRRFLAIVRPL